MHEVSDDQEERRGKVGMSWRALASITLALLVGLLVCSISVGPASAAVMLPDGFSDEHVVDVPSPIALAFTPDGRLLVTSKSGKLWVYENGQKTVALDLGPKVCANSERGLLGVAVPRDFGTTDNHVYLYYTAQVGPDCDSRNEVNRVSRFTMTGNTLTGSEEVLVDNIPSPNGNHNAGDLHFGKDGKLYVSVGDGGCHYENPSRCQYKNGASRDRHVLLGKVLRVERDGTIPTDNPFADLPNSAPCADEPDGNIEPGQVCEETFALGFRNPFRIAFDPDAEGTAFFVNDVGGGRWEEIDRGKAGADYGWNLCEGRHDNPDRRGKVNCTGNAYTGPIHEYRHKTGCRSITGGAFVPDGTSWPGVSDEAYLFGDFVCGKIFKLTPKDGGGFNRRVFARGLGPGPISMTFGPNGTDEALYYTTFAGGGQVRRIVTTGG